MEKIWMSAGWEMFDKGRRVKCVEGGDELGVEKETGVTLPAAKTFFRQQLIEKYGHVSFGTILSP